MKKRFLAVAVAGLVALVAVLPLTPGSTCVTVRITLAGISTESGVSSSA